MFTVVLCPGTPGGSTGSGSGFKASQKTVVWFPPLDLPIHYLISSRESYSCDDCACSRKYFSTQTSDFFSCYNLIIK